MIVGILFAVLPIVLVVLAIRRMTASGAKGGATSPLRTVFQFGALFALMIIVGNGLSGLLGRVINPADLLLADDAALALNLSFVVVGTPVLIGVGAWTRKSFTADPHLAKEPIASFFMTLASVVALITALSSWVAAIQSIFSTARFDGQSLANAIVWTLIWVGLWILQSRIIPADNLRIHYFVGSLIGYITSVVGLVGIIGAVVAQSAGMNAANLVSLGSHRIADAVVIALFGAIVWVQYWVRTASKTERDNLWLGYVLIAGVGSGLVMAVVAASTALYAIAVWFIGEPSSSKAIVHFAGSPTALGTVIVGLMSWWYHKAQLPETGKRTEVNRIYDYIIAGIGLIASAVGLSMILIAILESLIGTTSIVGKSAANTFLAAGTLILVGAPVWLIYWRGIQAEVKADAASELASPTRRIYLFILFGIGGVAALISLLVGVYQLFNDIFANQLGTGTIRDMRFALGVLVSTAIISAYHWEIYRHERDIDITFGGRKVSVLLVGPRDQEFITAVKEQTGAEITYWHRSDDVGITWPTDRVVAAINEATNDQLLVVLESTGLKVIPVQHK